MKSIISEIKHYNFNKLIDISFFLLVLFLGCIRFLNIGQQSPWLDEIYTLIDSNPNLSFKEIFDNITKNEVHPPIYFVLIYYYFKIFGYSIEILRFFSGFFGILCLILTYISVKNYFNKQSAQIGTLFLSVNSAFMGFSHEGRSYTFLIFFYICSFLLLHKSVNYNKTIFYTLLIVVNLILLYSTYFSVFIVFSQFLFIVYLYFFKDKKYKKLIFFYILLAIMYIPWIPYTFEGAKFTDSWIKKPNVRDLIFFSWNFLFPNIFLKVIIFLFFIFGVFRGVLKNKIQINAILISWIVGFCLFSYLFSIIFVPIIAWKYSIFILCPVIFIVSFGISEIKFAILKLLILAGFVITSLYLTFWKYSDNYKVSKPENYYLLDFIYRTNLYLPTICYEKRTIEWVVDRFNYNINCIEFKKLEDSHDSIKNTLLKNGWWELRVHRPFLTDNLRRTLKFNDSLVHFNYSNFSSLDLWIPRRKVIQLSNQIKRNDTIFYAYNSEKKSKIKFIFSVKSNLIHYDDSRLSLILNGQEQTFRLNYLSGIYSAEFFVDKPHFTIVLTASRPSVLENIQIQNFICISEN